MPQKVWIGNLNLKARKTTKHKLHKIWRSLYFCKNSGKQAPPEDIYLDSMLCIYDKVLI